MARPITLCTGQWADLPLEVLARKAAEWGLRRTRTRLLGRPHGREHGAAEALQFVRKLDFLPSKIKFDAQIEVQ